jgi:hypothetical protein
MKRSRWCLLWARPLVITLVVGITSCKYITAQPELSIRSDGLNYPTAGIPIDARGTAQSTQKLPNGNMTVRELHFFFSRDSPGRFWCRVHYVQPTDQPDSYAIIDPVEKRTLDFNATSKVETSRRLGIKSHVTISVLPQAQDDFVSHIPADRKRLKTKDLGKRMIAGVEADGKRTITTISPNAIGNTRPIVVVHEEWKSTEFQLVLAESDENPLSGNRKSEITLLTRGSGAPPGIFQPLPWLPIQEAAWPANK